MEVSYSFSLLPRDILFQILVRLGAKSRGKLSCVSKSFRSILTDPSFAEFQRNLSAALNHGTTILFSIQSKIMTGYHDSTGPLMLDSGREQFYTLNYEENQAGEILRAKIVRPTGKGWFQYGRSMSFAKDQICFFNKHSELIVFNLITGKHTTLPTTPSSSARSCALLGYDGVSGTYKVLKAEANLNLRTMNCWVLTLGVDETWRDIVSPVFFHLSRRFTNSVCIKGVIYFYNELLCCSGKWEYLFGSGCSELVAFDVRSESFHQISLPPATFTYFGKASWVELDGRFAFMYVNWNKQVIAWSLETSSWRKYAFPIPLEEGILEGDKTFITATPTGEIALLILKGTLSLWVLSDKFGADPVWKEFRVRGLADFTTGIRKTSEVVVAQNIGGNLLHLE
ncbi:unnamed protein product [Cuscuta epithymum]|uniref:F-box domain-containing protein n=1 Tax=Cuscuta epithymum TaxID=186058 RepID=A0AAV0DIL3_9ASTE|nr:unnamed protein product [Cuscuta epithymum]